MIVQSLEFRGVEISIGLAARQRQEISDRVRTATDIDAVAGVLNVP